MYYAMIVISVLLFGGNFALNRGYQKGMGSGLFPAFFLSALASFAGILALFPINGFRVDFEWFPFALALWTVVNNLILTFCGLKTLGKVNLSLYSLFLMLGGMVLPSVAGVLFFDEGMTVAKGLCYLFILAALLVTVERSQIRGGLIWYAGVFLLNGMSGVIAKVYKTVDLPKIPDSGYSLLCALCAFCVAGILALIFFLKNRNRVPFRPAAFGFGGGLLNQVANFLLLIALGHVPASVQYPMITGGVTIVSTVIACFTSEKPTKKQWLAVALSFTGIMLLVLLPF